jgi:hydrogenase maturation factor
MGTLSTTKFIKNSSGNLAEEAALTTSAGVGDAQKFIALNASGILDSTIVNSKTTSAGAGDSGKVVALDAAGKIDATMMPTGVAADVQIITTSEALAAGDWVNIHNSVGAKVRKADATTAGKDAHGFVLAAFASATAATVYFEGSNSAVTGQTAGVVFLSTTAGQGTTTAPSTSGNVVQRIGFATSATNVNFQSQAPITLA